MAKKEDDEKKKSALEASEPPWAKKGKEPEPAEDEDDDEDEDEDDDEDDDEPAPKAKAEAPKKAAAKPAADEDDEDEDEDEEEEDEEDEEPPPPPRSKRDLKPSAKKPVRAPERERGRPAPKKAAPAAADDGLPDWLPWAVMIGLIGIGVLGAMGVFSKKSNQESAADAPVAAAPAAEPSEISAQHLLVQYKGSMRAAPTVERTKEQAKARAEEALKKAKSGGNFDALVGEYSDEPNAAQRKGALGKFSKQMMVKEFSDAAFKLKVGEISGLVETPFGYHVIKRTE